MKDIRYLKKGDKISLIAPSFGCTTEPYLTRLDVAEKNIEEDGFILERGENIRLSKNKLRSNTARKCAQEFNKAYLESDSSTIISVGGGEIM
jgi:muramoyltetrapeptide carboxypeptidase LdcA involved in peptidoglycan recycling